MNGAVNVAAVAVLLLVPPAFRGCGSSPGDDDPVPLPTVDAGSGCVLDSDCMADECSDVRCVSGTCLEVAPTRDADLDGVAPPPCGMDCNDGNAAVLPGGSEQCDALDNDCDGVVDEDAPPGARRFDLESFGDATSVVLPWRPGFVVTSTSVRAPFGITGQPVLADGSFDAGLAFPAVSTETEAPRVHAGAAAPDGRLLVAAGTTGGRVHWSVLVPGAGGAATRMTGGSFSAPGPVARLAVAWHVDGWAVALDTEAPHARNLTFLPAGAPVLVPVESGGAAPASLAIASDGTAIAVSESDGIAFFADTGGRIARHPALGPLGRVPLASWDGDVVVTWADSFDWNLGHQRSTVARPAGVQAAPRLGTSSLGDLVAVARAADQIIVTRSSPGGTAAFVVRGGDFAPVRSFDEPTISGGGRGTPAPVSVAESEGAVAILTAFDRGAPSLAVLACGAL